MRYGFISDAAYAAAILVLNNTGVPAQKRLQVILTRFTLLSEKWSLRKAIRIVSYLSKMEISGKFNGTGIAQSVYRTSYGLENRGVGVRIPIGARLLSSPHRRDRFWGPPRVPIRLILWAFTPGCEADHSPANSTEITRLHSVVLN
jgi:hypothetical protein